MDLGFGIKDGWDPLVVVGVFAVLALVGVYYTLLRKSPESDASGNPQQQR